MKAHDEILRLMADRGGVILRRDHPELAESLKWLVRTGRLVSILPGTFVAQGGQVDPLLRVRAMSHWEPNAIFTHHTAARLSFWPDLRLQEIEVAVPYHKQPQAGYVFTRRVVPPELIAERGRTRFTTPSLTALDMSDFDHTDAIDRALRMGVTTLSSLHEALRLTPGRVGNRERRRVVLDSRENPWSQAERRSHRLLRCAGITGWKGNLPFATPTAHYFLDVGFRRLKLALEIDGRPHEEIADLFESDRWRQNALVLQGWRVLRFTWKMLTEYPEKFVADVRRAVAQS